jgi:hypothetical protein
MHAAYVSSHKNYLHKEHRLTWRLLAPQAVN